MLSHNLLTSLCQLLQLFLCKPFIILSNSLSLMGGLWSCLLTRLVIKVMGNPLERISFGRVVRRGGVVIAGVGVGLAGLAGWLVEVGEGVDCWVRPRV
jgi:hypothetical protein